jgi:hypothetical protein
MTRARSLSVAFAVLALVTLVSPAAAQDREYIRLLEKLLVGASGAINAEITDLRRQLARCDGPANQRLASDNCAARTLIQAHLNYLLRIGMEFGDPDTAGTRASTPVEPSAPLAPPDPSDYVLVASALKEKVDAEPRGDIVHVLSENRVKLTIISHCMMMNESQYIAAWLTDEETRARATNAGVAKLKADINACIKEYDAKEISANRKVAIEYCFQTYNYTTDPFGDLSLRARFDTCMNTRDMVQALCKQRSEHVLNYQMRKLPGALRRNDLACPGVQPSPGEIKAILSAPAGRAMAALPPKFLAIPPPPSPHPDYPVPAPPVPIPTGAVLEVTLNGMISAVGARSEHALEAGIVVPARLDRPLVVGSQTVLAPPAIIFLRARIVGPGTGPNSVRIGLTTHWVDWDRERKQGGYELKSDEIVFTVARQAPAPAGLNTFVPPDTRVRFTLGSSASSAAPAPGASPATPAAKPTPVPPTASTPPDPRQQQADERRKQAELQACVKQAYTDHPRGGVGLMQALSACTQPK